MRVRFVQIPPHLLYVLLEIVLFLFEPEQFFGLLFDRSSFGKDSGELGLDSWWGRRYFSMIGASSFAFFSRCLFTSARSLPSFAVFM